MGARPLSMIPVHLLEIKKLWPPVQPGDSGLMHTMGCAESKLKETTFWGP